MAVCTSCVCSGIFARAMGCCWLYNIDTLNICVKGFNIAGLHLVLGMHTVWAPLVWVTPVVGEVYAVG